MMLEGFTKERLRLLLHQLFGSSMILRACHAARQHGTGTSNCPLTYIGLIGTPGSSYMQLE
jgi:hypothetical protein